VQPTRLETVDGSLDPLGPLGVDEPTFPSVSSLSEQAPTPPRKESDQARGARPPRASQQLSSPQGAADAVERDDPTSLPRRTRGPPPVQPAGPGSLRQTQPSVSIEQAANPSFEITVGDPHKVGDITSSHIVYQVRTKVGAFPSSSQETTS
jgi:sorting nexin-1/2